MKFEDFISALHDCGWQATNDAQHTEIQKLWEKMFPVIAQLTAEVADLEAELMKVGA